MIISCPRMSYIIKPFYRFMMISKVLVKVQKLIIFLGKKVIIMLCYRYCFSVFSRFIFLLNVFRESILRLDNILMLHFIIDLFTSIRFLTCVAAHQIVGLVMIPADKCA